MLYYDDNEYRENSTKSHTFMASGKIALVF